MKNILDGKDANLSGDRLSTCSKISCYGKTVANSQKTFTIKINVLGFSITEKVQKEHSDNDWELEREGDERNVVIVEMKLISSNYRSKRFVRKS